jgi:hypothetical protein
MAGAFLSIAVATGCRDNVWTPLGSAEVILSEVKLRGAPAVSRRIDSDENFGRSVTNGIATGDSIWIAPTGHTYRRKVNRPPGAAPPPTEDPPPF